MTEDFLFTNILLVARKKESCYNNSASLFSLDSGDSQRTIWEVCKVLRRQEAHILTRTFWRHSCTCCCSWALRASSSRFSRSLSRSREPCCCWACCLSEDSSASLSLAERSSTSRSACRAARLPLTWDPSWRHRNRNRWVMTRCLNKEDWLDKAASHQSWK